jgi:O-antigen ligase/tetratricopeptide (TPR) repeat protein
VQKEGGDTTGERDPRALIRLDWISLGLLVTALLLAPLLAATFSTPPALSVLHLPDGLLDSFQNIGIPLVVLLVAAAIGVAVWREWRRPVAIGAAPGMAGAGVLLAAWSVISLVRTPALELSLNALMLLLAALATGTLVARLCRDRRAAATLVLTIIATGALVAAIGVREYLVKWKEGAPFYRTSAGFMDPNFTAGYLMLTLPVMAAVFVALDGRKAERSLVGLATGLMVAMQSACLLLTGSRTGAAAAAAGLLVWVGLCAWSGVARGRGKRLGMALALFALGAVLASAPTRSRFAEPATQQGKGRSANHTITRTTATESQSGQFRRYTWEGTIHMIRANPLLGTGIGSFEFAYPRYAITAFTPHAHNSLLQWTSETGLPGAMLLLATFAAATAFAVNVLRIRRAAAAEEPTEPETNASTDDSLSALLFREPALLISALLAALVASALKTFLDSDWYIVPTALLLAATVGFLVGLARNAAPLAVQMPRPLSRELLIGGALAALFLLWRAAVDYTARMDVATGFRGFLAGDPHEAVDADRAAIAVDPYDPESRLDLAQVYHALNAADNEKVTLEEAARVTPTGKVYYRLAQYFTSVGQTDKAIAAYDRARELEPKNIQTLRHLGETLEAAGRSADANAVYRTMTDLETSPYGTVRAVADELIETDFAYPHVHLAASAARAGQWADAAAQYARAADVLNAYWERRNIGFNQAIPAQKRRDLATLYHEVLAGWIEALHKQPGDAKTIADLETEMKRVDDEAQKDQEALNAQNAAIPGGGGQ